MVLPYRSQGGASDMRCFHPFSISDASGDKVRLADGSGLPGLCSLPLASQRRRNVVEMAPVESGRGVDQICRRHPDEPSCLPTSNVEFNRLEASHLM